MKKNTIEEENNIELSKSNNQSYFDQVNDLAYRLHSSYWKYKMQLCNEIKQY